ncbi:hypothetical protein BDV59DRAFT_200343 [Aspergillus ambiguus]|uniref:uncharacterized protein n=1 Tax=Aspergillus ambiguus TaxID=176160 RepID=UPI003CCE5178
MSQDSKSSRDYDTQSLTASVTDYPMENGRRYHKYHEGSYIYPNDEQELDRLDMQHHMLKLVNDGRLFFAPLQSPRRILDIGTGSGIWPIELEASVFPQAEITGTDLSPVQPTEVPENVHFLVDDAIDDDWLWGPDHFDFIHTGHLSGGFPSFKELLRKAFKHLKPGGYIECQEFDPKPKCDDGTMPPEDPDKFSTYPLQDWTDLNVRAGQAADPPRQFRIAHRLARWMREVGFVDVQERVTKIPTNPWPTDPHLENIGSWNEQNWLEALAGWSYKPLTFLGWSKPEIEVFLVDVRKAIQNRGVHSYIDYYVAQLLSHAPSALMSFGRHAYRHAVQPYSHGLLDHVWVSEDLLASTFRRFANSQRRYESRVPGPLEARRRLAKRRNTALAGMAGFGPLDDIACLFGRNGREHMKWSDGQSRKAPMDTGASDLYSIGASTCPSASHIPFYDENLDFGRGAKPTRWRAEPEDVDSVSQEECFGGLLETCQGLEDVWGLVRHLGIDLQRQPVCSRLIFDHLLARSVAGGSGVDEVAMFLDDPYLNVQGAGNYLGAVKHVSAHQEGHVMPTVLLRTIVRALELGKVHPAELSGIVGELSEKLAGMESRSKRDMKLVVDVHKQMWRAIGRCDVFGYKDLGVDIIDAWLGALSKTNTYDGLLLAKEMMLASRCADSPECVWVSVFIQQWLESPEGSRFRPKGDYTTSLLRKLPPAVASAHIISVTKALMLPDQRHLLERWQHCLRRLPDVDDIASTQVWVDRPAKAAKISPHQEIISRLWVLRTLSQNLPQGPLWIQKQRTTDLPIAELFNQYEALVGAKTEGDFLMSFMKGIHDLGMPYNGLLMLAVELKTRRRLTAASRKMFEHLETSKISLPDTFTDLNTYNSMVSRCFSTHEKMVRQIDVTSPSFIEQSIQLARTGDARSIWTLLRLLRAHTPLKIALAMSWQPIPDASEKVLVRYYSTPRTAECPDPHVALEMVHLLAISISCSKTLSPPRAYALVHWLYAFLMRHNAPVRPVLVRAMYHAGVLRCRREGYSISPTKYEFIFNAIKRFEGPDVVTALMEPPRLGRTVDSV